MVFPMRGMIFSVSVCIELEDTLFRKPNHIEVCYAIKLCMGVQLDCTLLACFNVSSQI